jgi:hypothetical protein
MKKSPQISEQRKIVKQEITALIEETVSAKLLRFAGSIIQKLTGQTNPLPWYVGAVVLTIVAILPQILIALILRQPDQIVGGGLMWSLAVLLAVQAIPLTYLVSRYNTRFICDHIIDNIEDVKHLEDLRIFCVERLGNRQWMLSYALLASVIWSIIAISIFSVFNHGFIGLIHSIDLWIFGFCAPGLGLYFIQVLIQLPNRLGNYHYKVYELNPAQSEVINHIATLFTRPFLAIAIYLAICTFISSLLSEFLWVAVVVVILWIPMIVEFINGQNAINKIISSAKWQALNRIQEQIRKHQDDINSDSPGNIESLNKLMDLYERVYSTNSFKLTIRSTLEFLNQLLLPLLAFLTSNYDSVLKFFKLNP